MTHAYSPRVGNALWDLGALRVLALLFGLFALPACSAPPMDSVGPVDPAVPLARDTDRAMALTAMASEILSSPQDNITKWNEAEPLLREAGDADAFYGPAHNNLGVLHLSRGDLPDAASSFELAATLMPTSPEPRVNLAIVLERAGRFDAAAREYSSALELSPNHTRAAQALVSLQLRHNLTDDRTPSLLDHVALHGETRQWREWAMEQRARLRP